MKKILKGLCATGIAATFTIGSAAPAISAPLAAPPWLESNSNVTPIAHKGDRDRRDGPYYRGYRGSRHHHPGYRRHNDFWFPLAAFGLGAIVGGAVSGGGGNAHVQWCYDRYRSYRAFDNTYQPYNGPRRPCFSPYG
jgi:hypothetical protein